ncbi:divergent polysaccharide deacetylase family protein [Alkalibacillus haloalkaliphilus]|uniref:divergent polysaccharide deacetylase family protein n=1 Tax=Alkalibacillus haloalkaliphilus TaxID=94136 RepID=UPI0002F225BA|nr:divergent polysaccharide deacetylase family protein [Alkalibacillus haloalkaliphilus]
MKRVVVLCVMLMVFYIWIIEITGDEAEGTGAEEILSLDIPLTVAVMPFGPYTQETTMAYENGHEVIVHLSMEGRPGTSRQLGEGAITTQMGDDEIKERVQDAIDDVPYAVGINNHMDSVVTEDERVMQQVLSAVQERGMMYVDSKSNYFSVAPDVAEGLGVPLLRTISF